MDVLYEGAGFVVCREANPEAEPDCLQQYDDVVIEGAQLMTENRPDEGGRRRDGEGYYRAYSRDLREMRQGPGGRAADGR